MKYDKQYLYNAYNATSTGDENGELETYENWLERQLLSRIKRLDEMEKVNGANAKNSNCNIPHVSNRTSVDFKKLRDAYFKEHVTHKTTDGIPMVCTHPHNLFEWFKAELKEYGC